MTIHSGRRTGEPSRVIQGRSKRPAVEPREGFAAKPSPERGLPQPMIELLGRVTRLEREVAELRKGRRNGT